MRTCPRAPRWARTTCYSACLLHLLILGSAVYIVHANHRGTDVADVLVSLPQWVWLPVPALLTAGCLVFRLWIGAAVNGGALLTAALALSGFSLGAVLPAGAPRGIPVRIVTWNVHNAYTRSDAVRNRLLSYNPDIVLLQEASNRNFHGFLAGWHETSSTSLRMYTRPPLTEWREPSLAVPVFRRWLPATVELEGGRLLHVLNIHSHSRAGGHSVIEGRIGARDYLKLRERLQGNQFPSIAVVARNAGPVIACGDLNTPPTARVQRMLRRRLTDAFAAKGFGLGLTYLFEGRVPMWRIDYVWCGGGARPVRCFTAGAYPSDHRPVIADIVVPTG